MSDVNKEKITTLAKLCRLEFSEEEIEGLCHDFDRILSYMEKLQSIDFSDLTAYSHMDEQSLATLRADEVTAVLPRETFLSNSPEHVGGLIRVPTIIRHV
jgi:aspartyl-tRNA(Asn)/glutamyl-tRNA(Gln) amidotransferase subunit C